MAYIGKVPRESTLTKNVFTATASQTTFSCIYDISTVSVFLNGVLLASGIDYTATNGTSIVMTTGLTVGDIVEVHSIRTLELADVVPATAGGTFLGPVNVNNTLDVTGSLTVASDPVITQAQNIVNFTGSGALQLPSGTTAERPVTPVAGQVRWNETLGIAEAYNGTEFAALGGGGYLPIRLFDNTEVLIASVTGTTLTVFGRDADTSIAIQALGA